MSLINLKDDFGSFYTSIEKVFVCEFISGHGGDFFITLYSTCNNDFIRFKTTEEDLKERLYTPNTNMPGNNIGGKLIRYDSVLPIKSDLMKIIEQNINNHNTKKKYLNTATHPISLTYFNSTGPEQKKNSELVYPSETLFDLFDLEYKAIVLVPTTFMSYCFIKFYNDSLSDDQEVRDVHMIETLTAHTPKGPSIINSKKNISSITCIDHIDILLNCHEQLLPLCKKLVNDNFNEEMFNMTLEFYLDKKIKLFLEWFNNLNELRENQEIFFNKHRSDHDFFIVNSSNIHRFLDD